MQSSLNDKPLIFLVDNDPTVAALLPIEFTDLGYDFRAVREPDTFRSEFLKLYVGPAYRSPIFLLDVALNGDETGWNLVDFIRRYDKDCLIFMYTGRVNKIVDRMQLKKHGANGMIYKPKDAVGILAEIKKYETRGHGTNFDSAQAGGSWFSNREMAVYAINILIFIAVAWSLGRIETHYKDQAAGVDRMEHSFKDVLKTLNDKIEGEEGTRSMSFNVLDGSIKEVKGALGQINKGK